MQDVTWQIISGRVPMVGVVMITSNLLLGGDFNAYRILIQSSTAACSIILYVLNEGILILASCLLLFCINSLCSNRVPKRMAVDVMHLSPSESFTKMAFGQSKSAEELKESTYQDPELSIVAESPTTCSSGKSSLSSSLTDLSLSADGGRLAVEQLNSTRKQLEREIDVSAVS